MVLEADAAATGVAITKSRFCGYFPQEAGFAVETTTRVTRRGTNGVREVASNRRVVERKESLALLSLRGCVSPRDFSLWQLDLKDNNSQGVQYNRITTGIVQYESTRVKLQLPRVDPFHFVRCSDRCSLPHALDPWTPRSDLLIATQQHQSARTSNINIIILSPLHVSPSEPRVTAQRGGSCTFKALQPTASSIPSPQRKES